MGWHVSCLPGPLVDRLLIPLPRNPPHPLPPPLVRRTIVIVITELFTKGWRHKHLRGKRGNTDMLQEKFIHSDTEQLLMVKYFIIA